MIIGFLLASAVYFAVDFGGNRYINKYYLSEESRAQREESFVKDLQSYVTKNKLSSEDTADIAKWVQSNKYLYVMIYKDDQLIIDSDTAEEEIKESEKEEGDGTVAPNPDGEGSGQEQPEGDTKPDGDSEAGEEEKEDNGYVGPGITVQLPSREELIAYAEASNSHLIDVEDGHILASMADFSEYFYYDVVNIASIVSAVLVFTVAVMIYIQSVTRRITKLAQSVTKVAEGDMQHEIVAQGKDEISKLSSDVENMRSYILENLEKERLALNANAELITAMSHDIRTPLTVLFGYLDMMKLHSTDEVMQGYIKASENTAVRLKKLSDDMFNYFLVFGADRTKLNIEEYDARTLVEQLLAEHILLLSEQGWTVKSVGLDSNELSGLLVKPTLRSLCELLKICFPIYINMRIRIRK